MRNLCKDDTGSSSVQEPVKLTSDVKQRMTDTTIARQRRRIAADVSPKNNFFGGDKRQPEIRLRLQAKTTKNLVTIQNRKTITPKQRRIVTGSYVYTEDCA